MAEIWKNITSVDFWWGLLKSFQHLGPLAPIILSMIESFVPPLPMVAIVTINVAAHGPFLGFLYSWVGTCVGCTLVFLFFRHVFQKLAVRVSDKHPKIMKARNWVGGMNAPTLFMLVLLPFTPSAFLNFAFGVSEYSRRKYLFTLYFGKLIMIALLAVIGQSAVSALENPWYLVLSGGVLVCTYILSKLATKLKVRYNKNMKYIFFDLDGTLAKTSPGVLDSFNYALSKFGIKEENKERQRQIMGPPLTVSFKELYGLSDEDTETAIKHYRKFYEDGAYKNAPLYDGIETTLRALKKKGYILMVVTSKPKYLAERVINYLNIEWYFHSIVGPVEEKKNSDKAELIEKAMKILGLTDCSKVVMVGDRRYDMAAAKKLGATAVGALYGYGTKDELDEAGADYIVEDPKEIIDIVEKI